MTSTDRELTSLAASHDIISLGAMADDLRRQRHGTKTTFVRVAEVAADSSAPIVIPPAAGEVRIVGVPDTRAAGADRVVQVAAAANGVAVSGFSLADLEELAARESITLRALLEQLRAAGLEMISEAPIDRLRDARRSIEEVNISGLALARVTIHQSQSTDPMAQLKAVAELQRTVAVIRAFAPLPRRVNPAVPTTGYEDIKRVALARIVADNVPSIQADWSLYGPKLAQVALTVGADDVDGVSADDDVSKGYRRSPLEEIRRNIRAAGYEPVQRTGRWDVLRTIDELTTQDERSR
jgi:aminodeoxyfutalosine synthase